MTRYDQNDAVEATGSTQTDRIFAVLLSVVALAVVVALVLEERVELPRIGVVTGLVTVLIVPVVIFLLARQWSAGTIKALAGPLAEVRAATQVIAQQTNGSLTTRLDAQTDAIVARVVSELRDPPPPDDSIPE